MPFSTDGSWDQHITNGWEPLSQGTEWILFLAWDSSREMFAITHLQWGMLEIREGRIMAPADSPVSRRWSGHTVEELAEALRAVVEDDLGADRWPFPPQTAAREWVK